VLLGVLTLAVLALPSAGFAIVDLNGDEGLADLDTRTGTAVPTSVQLDAAHALGATVAWNRFGTPSSIYNLHGNLATGIQAPDAVAATRAWLQDQKSLFRLGSSDSLALLGSARLVGSDARAVTLAQRFDGVLAVPDGVVTVAVTGSRADGWNVTFASSTLTADDGVANDYDLSAVDAWLQAAKAVGLDVSAADVSVTGTKKGWTRLHVDGIADTQAVRKAAFPKPGTDARAVYQAVVADSAAAIGYSQSVDASTGRIVQRENIVDQLADNPVWKAFPTWPITSKLNRFPWNYPSADVRDTWCWNPIHGCDLALANPANFAGADVPWDQTAPDPTPPSGTTPTFTTRGNNANDREQWIAPTQANPAGATLYQPTSADRNYVYPWTNAWFRSSCDPNNLAVPPTGPAATQNDISAAVANLFAMHNRMHDWSYYLGFTEENWNGQNDNYGAPATNPINPSQPVLGGDPVTGNAQQGAVSGGFPSFNGRDNANMGTRPDGTSSVTNMFLWQPIAGSFYAPCVDGDYDMSVIGHEYGHMIENRMIGKGRTRQGTHAGAMGEAFGDFDALEYLNENHLVPVYGLDPFVEGAYVTGNPFRGIRDYAADWDMSGPTPQPGKTPFVNSLNLGDYGFDIVGPEPHADGEMWVATEFTLRQLFLDRYPSHGATLDKACAIGKVPVARCPGDRRWIQLYFDSMLLMPTRPSLIDARDAFLAADQSRFGGANQDIIWKGFAERGFGQFASATSSQDTDPVPDFGSPFEHNATVTFRAVDAHGAPITTAKVYVGDYEARVTQIADTDPATVNADPVRNQDDQADFVAGGGNHGHGKDKGVGYNFVASAPGYGHVRFRIDDLRPGEHRTVTIEFPTNYASGAQGGTATGDGTNLQNLLDDTEGTTWDSTGTTSVRGRQVVIHLGGTGADTFRAVSVSAMLVPGQNRFTALRKFELYACTAGKSDANPTCDGTIAAGWSTVLVSQSNAFPSVNPRPVGPDMQLRTWDVKKTTATHVLFRVLDNQCTGQSSYQGEQDSDPTFSTDCRVTSLTSTGAVGLPERDTEVHAAEVQVLSDLPDVRGAEEDYKGSGH
jgi:hypothetical protein